EGAAAPGERGGGAAGAAARAQAADRGGGGVPLGRARGAGGGRGARARDPRGVHADAALRGGDRGDRRRRDRRGRRHQHGRPGAGLHWDPVQEVLEVPNEVAAELAGIEGGLLDVLRDRLGCAILLRGNRLTLEGEDAKVSEARAVVEELVELVVSGQQVGERTIDTILNAIDQAE